MIPLGLGEYTRFWVVDAGAVLIGNFRDAFAGGFVAGIVQGKPLEQSIDMGHWLASLSIKELGPQYVSIPPLSPSMQASTPNMQLPLSPGV